MKENSSCSLHHTIDKRSINNDEIELRSIMKVEMTKTFHFDFLT